MTTVMTEEGLMHVAYVVACEAELEPNRTFRAFGRLAEAYAARDSSNERLDLLIESGQCQVLALNQYEKMRYKIYPLSGKLGEVIE